MKERIILLIRALNFTSAQFADEIGVQKSGISHIISGRNNPSLDFVQKILQRFPEVNMEWLIMGKGSMIKGEPGPTSEPENKSTLMHPAGGNQSLDLFSVQISPVLEDKPLGNVAETLAESGIPAAEEIRENNPHFIQESPLRRDHEMEIKKATPQSLTEVASEKKIEKIMFFYSDKTFSVFCPES